MSHCFFAPSITVDVTDDGNLHIVLSLGSHKLFWREASRDFPSRKFRVTTHIMWIKSARWQMGMASWLRRGKRGRHLASRANDEGFPRGRTHGGVEDAVSCSGHVYLAARSSNFW